MNYRLILSVTLLVLVAIFIVQNTTVVQFRFLFWTLEMSRALMFFLILGAGIITGWFLHGHFGQIRKR